MFAESLASKSIIFVEIFYGFESNSCYAFCYDNLLCNIRNSPILIPAKNTRKFGNAAYYTLFFY
ncbi:hypothetical protein TSAR_009498 [Trichomalopsis sarcophagae]|uniref:Uncharacterized protein n=1 Tax=Trichomalopsis sarcophagae TaxID=543379 RepID=A0A232F9Z6_9HYME|nr:hypothetical protein TSAR_009498 [Trichomalopsis sarcophagae]